MIPEITLLRTIGILLVVLGHSDIGGQKTPYLYPFIKTVVYSFHMPLFMFISGFVFMYSKRNKDRFIFADFIKKKMFRLLIPSFLILAIAFLLRKGLSYTKGTGVDSYPVINFLKMFFLKDFLPIEFFWFIFVLFEIFLLAKLFFYCIKNKYLLLLLSFVLIVMNQFPVDVDLFYIKFTSAYMLYFWVGCLCCLLASESRLVQLSHSRNVSLILSVLFLFVLISFNLIKIETEIGGLICAITGILLSYSFVIYLNQFKLTFLRSIGKYSYQIFLLSWFFHRIVETVGFQKLHLTYWATYPLSFCLAVAGPLLIAKILEMRIPKMKFVLGL